jgi:GT2 family glycosyltransferase
MKPIPVIGVPVLKNPKWIKRLYLSVDYPTDNFVIFNNNGKGEITEDLENLKKLEQPFVKNLTIVHLPSNLGVSTAWNLIIKSYLMSPYWIITNDDIAFTEGFLQEMVEAAKDSETGMVHGYGGDFGIGAWDLFLIKDWVIQEYGLFDENLYPAYCEDADYIMRLVHNPIKTIPQLSKKYYHGDGFADEYYTYGSQTKKSSEELTRRLDEINEINFEYLNKKWGEGWRQINPYRFPMNHETTPITYTTYDLEFARKKHLGL